MFSENVLDHLKQRTREGQAELSETVKVLVYRKAPGVFERLDCDDDELFLQPSLFALLTQGADTAQLGQTLFGAMDPESRPRTVNAQSGHDGAAYLPGLGYITGMAPYQQSELRCGRHGEAWHSATGNGAEPLDFSSTQWVAGGQVELTHRIDPAIAYLFNECERTAEAEIAKEEIPLFRRTIDQALTIMEQTSPEIFELIRQVTRRIHLYRSPLPNSFAALSVHGAAFFNTRPQATVIFFLDDLAHQCGHIIFNAATLHKDRILNLDPETPLQHLMPQSEIVQSDDNRSLYSAVHGLFTYSSIITVLDAAAEHSAIAGTLQHELEGRLAFYLIKFRIDLEDLGKPEIFTEEGQFLYSGFLDCYESVLRKWGSRIGALDCSNQPYVFDFDRFTKLNPETRCSLL